MTFFWPQMLWCLLTVPALLALYVWLTRRRQHAMARYAHLGMVREALTADPSWRRHAPPLLLLAAFVMVIVSLARPAAYLTTPQSRGVVVLAIDASGSMLETDVEPNRLIAAQNAVREFISDQPRNVRIGLVAFSGSAFLLQEPTDDRAALLAAVDRIRTDRATAMGDGILASLAAIFQGTEVELELDLDWVFWNARDLSASVRGDRPAVEPGSHESAAIIVLSDGASNRGSHPIRAAQLAADLGVRVYTVGLGNPEISRFLRASRRLDEPTLIEVADMTRARYFPAGSEHQLREVYRELGSEIVVATEATEVTALFSALAGFIALLGALMSLLWFNRLA